MVLKELLAFGPGWLTQRKRDTAVNLTLSPSTYGTSSLRERCSATVVLPQPAGPVTTQMCRFGADICVPFAIDIVTSDAGMLLINTS